MRLPLILMASLLLTGTAIDLQAQEEEERRYQLAWSYEEAGRLADAARVYLELYRSDTLSVAYFEGVKRTLGALGRTEELLPIVRSRANRFPSDWSLAILLGELLWDRGRVDSAAAQFRRIHERAPDNRSAYSTAAEAFISRRAFDSAVAVYELALRRLGPDLNLLELQGRALVLAGRHQEAIETFLSLVPKGRAGVTSARAGIALLTNDPEVVHAARERAESLATDQTTVPEYWEIVGWLAELQGDAEGALAAVAMLDRLKMSNGMNVYAYGDRALREGNYALATRVMEFFLENYEDDHPMVPTALFTYVRALEGEARSTGRIDAGLARDLIDRYRRVIESAQRGDIAATATLRIAELQAEVLGDPEAALETLESKEGEIGSEGSLQAELLRAQLFLKAGQADRTLQTLRRAAAVRGVSVDLERLRDLARFRVGETLFLLGRFDEATDSLRQLTLDLRSHSANDALELLFLVQANREDCGDALDLYARGLLHGRQGEIRRVLEAMRLIRSTYSSCPLTDEAVVREAEMLVEEDEALAARDLLIDLVEGTIGGDGTQNEHAMLRAAEVTDLYLDDPREATRLYARFLSLFPQSRYASQAREAMKSLRERFTSES